MTKKEQLLNSFDQAIELGHEIVAVLVEIEEYNIAEIIINFSENFEEKKEYYDNAYNDDLVHCKNENINIVDFYFASTSKQLYKKYFKTGLLRRGKDGS